MREILFRGKRIDNGEWVYGSFCMDAIEQKKGPCGMDGFIRLFDFDNNKMQMCEVDRDTVGQFTGLCDKNGKKIFEGDRIEIRGYVYYCCWDAGNLEFILINEKESFGMGYAASSRMTVIGNVHDNPELFGG